MTDPQDNDDKSPDLPLVHLLPNLLTITAICAGLTAIRFGFQGEFETSARLILLACILDGLDGRLARALHCESPFGAELDSLADFLNFGVAPGLILHSWILQDAGGLGWIAAMAYAVCCVMRLARFNVSGKIQDKRAPDEAQKGAFFIGVPSPAGALLALLPLFLSFLYPESRPAPGLVALYLLLIGGLMISRMPTHSFKDMSIARKHSRLLILAGALIVSGLLTNLWATIVLLCLAYTGTLLHSVYRHFIRKRL